MKSGDEQHSICRAELGSSYLYLMNMCLSLYRLYPSCLLMRFFEFKPHSPRYSLWSLMLIVVVFLLQLIACGVAVATYNEGATDFKDTTVYKESVQSRDLLDEPDASSSDVFESNPTEQAPSLE